MRINRFVAAATGMSRRAADTVISDGRVKLNDSLATLGQTVQSDDVVSLDGAAIELIVHQTIMLHKPTGYVTSRRQQGSMPTIYALLPPEMHHLKPVGRLDQDSSGLLLLTNDGALAQRMQHPSFGKWKTYMVRLNRALTDADLLHLSKGVQLEDGMSKLRITRMGVELKIELQEGRNRQIRRSFAALDYLVTKLHRLQFGPLKLDNLEVGTWRDVAEEELS